MTQLDEADPIWGDVPAEVFNWDYGGRRVRSDRIGGSVEIPSSMLGAISALSELEKAKLTSWIFERNRYGDAEWPRITADVLNQIRQRRSLSTGERMDRLLEYLSIERYRPGNRPTWLGPHTTTLQTASHRKKALVWTESGSDAELNALRDMLIGEGMLADNGGQTTITAAGFRRMEQLERGDGPTDQVFVAMWFNEETALAFSSGISPAIIAAGYRPLRIDQKEHANKIDDEIIAEIRRSRFIVADFTCGTVKAEDGEVTIPRGGVYYEAGFAQGLGIPVIWSVRENQVNEVHFDTRQYNHITWIDPEELKLKLFNRIGAMFGHRSDAPGFEAATS